MKKIVILLIGLLVLANVAFAAEQAEDEEEGFFAKLFSFFKPKDRDVEPKVLISESAEESDEETSGKPVPEQYVDYGDHVEYELDEVPIESGSVEGYEGEVETIEVRPMPMPVPEPMPPIQVEPQTCEANICYNDWQQEVFCPADFKSCARKYDNCRVVSCNPPKPYPQPCVCPACPTPIPTPVCREDVHLCIQTVLSEDGTDIASYTQVKCEGRYEDCVEKYKKCQCGLPEPEPQPVSPPVCEEKVHTCKKWVYETTGSEDSATSTASAHIEYVTCEGTFEQCEEGHVSCACGLVDGVQVYTTTASAD